MATLRRQRRLLGVQRNGWWIVLHPAFRAPLLALQAEVTRLERRGDAGWEAGPKPKLLRRIVDLILSEIPADPGAPIYEQGKTLGADARGWRRAKFLGRFRLFFRFDSGSKVIVYAWVNDENTLRKSGSATDPYVVFRGMLVAGDPPGNWMKLLDACRTAEEHAGGQALGQVLVDVETVREPLTEAAKIPKKRKRGKQ